MNFRYFTRLFTVVLIIFLLGMGQANASRTKVAVLDFEMYGNDFSTKEIGEMVSEWFITSLVNDGRFEIVERAQLSKILAEQNLGALGVIDDSSASKLGKILGVNVVVTGTVLKFADELEINSRIISVEEGSIIAADNIRCRSEEELDPVVKELTAAIMKNFPITGYVVKKNNDKVLIDIGKGAGVHLGMEFDVFKEGKEIKHPVTGDVLGVARVHTGHIRVVKFQGNVTRAKILSEESEGIAYGQLVESVQGTTKSKDPSVQDVGIKKETSSIAVPVKQGKEIPEPVVQKDANQTRKKTVRKEVWKANTSDCPALLKAWQLGDASVMQQYIKECTK